MPQSTLLTRCPGGDDSSHDSSPVSALALIANCRTPEALSVADDQVAGVDRVDLRPTGSRRPSMRTSPRVNR